MYYKLLITPFLTLLTIELKPYLLINNIIKYPIKVNKGNLILNNIKLKRLLP